jgi:hypothetical protein
VITLPLVLLTLSDIAPLAALRATGRFVFNSTFGVVNFLHSLPLLHGCGGPFHGTSRWTSHVRIIPRVDALRFDV